MEFIYNSTIYHTNLNVIFRGNTCLNDNIFFKKEHIFVYLPVQLYNLNKENILKFQIRNRGDYKLTIL